MDTQVSVGQLAEELLRRRQEAMRRDGGLTPANLQALAGEMLQTQNRGMQVVPLSYMMRDVAREAEELEEGRSALAPDEFAAGVLMILLHLAHMYQFDLLERGYQALDLMLQDATVTGNQQ